MNRRTFLRSTAVAVVATQLPTKPPVVLPGYIAFGEAIATAGTFDPSIQLRYNAMTRMSSGNLELLYESFELL